VTDTVHAQPTAGPPPGWYPDPGGSSAQRWWNGAGWTEALQSVAAPAAAPVAPAPVVAPVAPAPVVAPTSAPAPTPAPVPVQPAEVPFGTPRVAAAGHARLHASPTSSNRSGASGKTIALIVAAVVVLAALGLLAVKLTSGGSDDATGLVPTGTKASVPVTPAQATVLSDSLTVATAEETAFTDNEAYVAVHVPSNRLVLNGQSVPLSAGNTATVTLASAGSAYCIRVVGTSGVAVYVSDRGGRQPPSVTGCPPGYTR